MLTILTPLLLLLAQQPTGQVLEDGRLVDHDYRFELAPPSNRWAILDELGARALAPDAVAALQLAQTSLFAFVVVEPMEEETDLEELAEQMVFAIGSPGSEVADPAWIEHEGHRAYQYGFSAEFQGMHFSYVNHLFLQRGFLWQLTVGRQDARIDGDSRLVKTALESFHLHDGEVRVREVAMDVFDQDGPGWSVREGVYHSAAHGFRIGGTQGFLPLVGQELIAENADAEVLLRSEAPEIDLTLVVEAIPGVTPEGYASMFELEENPLVELDFGGSPCTVHFLYDLGEFGGEVGMGLAFHGDRAFQLEVTFWEGQTEEAVAALHELVATFSLLEGEELAAEDARARAQMKDRRWTDLDSSLIQGVYRHFEQDVMWELPDGYWRLDPDIDEVEDEYGDISEALVAFELAEAGVYGELEWFWAEDDSPEEAHGYQVAGLIDSGFEVTRATQAIEVNGRQTFITVAVMEDEPMDFSVYLATLHVDDEWLDFRAWAPSANVLGALDALDAAVQGVHLPGDVVEEAEDGEVYFNHMFGWSLDPGPVEARRVMMPFPAETGSAMSWQLGGGEDMYMVLSVDMLDPRAGLEGLARVWENGVGPAFANHLGGMERRPDELLERDGREVMRMVWDNEEREAKLDLIVIDRLAYLMFRMGERDDPDLERLHAGLRLER